MSKIRLLVNFPALEVGQIIDLADNDFNYLIRVMRLKIDSQILIFNGQDGEYLARISQISKNKCQIEVLKLSRSQYFPPKITLAFALVKNVRVDFIAAKATELGVTNFQPLITKHSIVNKLNHNRFTANIKEAAEQCGRVDLPQLQEVKKLNNLIKNCQKEQIFILCDESGAGGQASVILPKIDYAANINEIIILTGPEGGFSDEEFEQMRKISNIHSISLGPRILRADTAIISAITLVQEFMGDFK